MIRLSRLTLIAALSLCGAVAVTATPAIAKKKNATDTVTVQKQKKRVAGQDCRRGPVPPFMRNPRYMNRGFLKKRC